MKGFLCCTFLLLFSVNAKARTSLTLSFDSQRLKHNWISWYLDNNGEDISGFYAEKFDSTHMKLTKEGRIDNTANWNKPVRISDLVIMHCNRGTKTTPFACVTSARLCIDYAEQMVPVSLEDVYPERELSIVLNCLNL
jgi:hypothetical protein